MFSVYGGSREIGSHFAKAKQKLFRELYLGCSSLLCCQPFRRNRPAEAK